MKVQPHPSSSSFSKTILIGVVCSIVVVLLLVQQQTQRVASTEEYVTDITRGMQEWTYQNDGRAATGASVLNSASGRCDLAAVDRHAASLHGAAAGAHDDVKAFRESLVNVVDTLDQCVSGPNTTRRDRLRTVIERVKSVTMQGDPGTGAACIDPEKLDDRQRNLYTRFIGRGRDISSSKMGMLFPCDKGLLCLHRRVAEVRPQVVIIFRLVKTYRVTVASTLSLADSLAQLDKEQAQATTLIVMMSARLDDKYEQWSGWLRGLFGNGVVGKYEEVRSVVPSDWESWQTVMKRVTAITDDDTIVMSMEEDYILRPSAIQEMVDVFRAHDAPFVLPYDYMDRYMVGTAWNRDDGKITIVPGTHRHWRTVASATVTMAGRVGAFKLFLNCLPRPMADHQGAQAIIAAGGFFLSPLPGLATHFQDCSPMYPVNFGLSFYSDWSGICNSLFERAKGLSYYAFGDDVPTKAATLRSTHK